jgi:hypothetical protein
METKNQTSKVSKNQFKYDYSELDKFLHGVDPDDLSCEFRNVHSSLTHALALLINNSIETGVYDLNELYSLNEFFQILDHLKENTKE